MCSSSIIPKLQSSVRSTASEDLKHHQMVQFNVSDAANALEFLADVASRGEQEYAQ